MKKIRSTFYALFVGIALTGCAPLNSCSPLDPSQGWRRLQNQDPGKLDKAIQDDYLEYINGLSSKKGSFIGDIFFFGNSKGSHAVEIERGREGRYDCHTLLYDERNKRVRVIKYACGGYRS